MDKQAIIKNFSKYAHHYDKYANIQRRVAKRLLSQIGENNFRRILEIGCGTGNYTLLLRERFKSARIKVIDISDKMIELAKDKLKDKDIEFVCADAEKIDLNETFDLITSNACFQWFEDLQRALRKYKHLLKKRGVISFSIFGPYTFWELNSVLKQRWKNFSIEADSFITKDKLKDILNKNFKEVEIRQILYKETFPSLIELLRKIKYTGERGDNQISLFRGFLKKLEDIYLDKFKKIIASYQVFLCKGV